MMSYQQRVLQPGAQKCKRAMYFDKVSIHYSENCTVKFKKFCTLSMGTLLSVASRMLSLSLSAFNQSGIARY